MKPIKKNIFVVDEYGNEYEATYPKRAWGLVKNGRARFLSENKICLACPPNHHLEDHKMTDTNMMDIHVTDNPAEKEYTNAGETSAAVSLTYIFSQIKSIHEKTDYLQEAIHALSQMPDGDSGESYSPGNIMGEQRARALGDIVRCRETTNQQLLNFYMTVYNDMKSQS